MAKQIPTTLFEFQNQFNAEEVCYDHLYRMKWPNGFQCPKCSHPKAYQISTRKLPLYECCACRHQTTVLVGTVFEKTRTDLRKWFWAIFLASQDKRGVSACLIADQLDVCYQTAWSMLQKIRRAMGERDAHYQLGGLVEMDDSFFGAPTAGGKRGRGTDKTKVVIGLSLNHKGYPTFLKMKVVPDLKGSTLTEFAKQNLKGQSTVVSDAYGSYNALSADYDHNPQVFAPDSNSDHLKWLHIVVSNAKAFIMGTYHGLGAKHLQSYLDEFCYRFNRRSFKGELFNRLIHCCLTSKPVTYPELIR